MELQYYCWIFKSVLTPKFCDDLINIAKTKKEEIAWTGLNKPSNQDEKGLKDLRKTRDSNIVWMEGGWIYRELHYYINKANQDSGWNYEWDYSETCQFTKYELNQHYTWHVDSWKKPYKTPNEFDKHGKIRKLSVTCALSHPEDYEGGELQLNIADPSKSNQDDNLITLSDVPRGSIIVFPSFLWHRVKPVTNGIRYSLVVWNLGRPFR